MRVAIIEDEILIADRLWELLSGIDSDIELVHRMRSIQEGLDFFSNSPQVDLVFSDIELLDGKSFEIFKRCPQKSPIIFCTAFDEYALEAFEVNGIDYILKPFSQDRIAETLEKYRQLTGGPKGINIEALAATLRAATHKHSGSILAHKGDKITPISFQEIALIHLDNGISNLYTFDGLRHRVDQKMEALENMLGPDFYRLNRQVIIQRKAVSHASAYFARKLKVEASIPFHEDLVVSKAGASSFLQWLASA